MTAQGDPPLLTSTHWGVTSPTVTDGRLTAAPPFSEDFDPSPLLTSIPDAVHARNRVARPAVRRGWLEGTGTRRGADEFIEIPWDEALDLVASEIRRVQTEHGHAAILGGSYGWSSAGRFHHAKSQLNHFLACSGGYTSQFSNYSFAAAEAILPHVVGDTSAVTGRVATWDEIAEHTDVILMFGGAPIKNTQVEPGGLGSHTARLGFERALAAGVKVLNINPVGMDIPTGPNVRWTRIRPNTDTAVILALIHTLVSTGRADRGFLDTCTVGFDRFWEYVSGAEDGVVKDAEWAERISGVSAAEIEDIADVISSGRTLVTATWALQRAEHGEQPYWAIIALAAVLGQIGLIGGGFGFGYGCIAGTGAGHRDFGTPSFPPRRNPIDSGIPVARLTDLLLHPGQQYEFNGTTRTYPDIRMIYWAGGNPFHHHQDINRLVEAWQRPDTIVVHEPWWTPTAKLADIVLPATTAFERDDIGAGSKDGYIIAMRRAVQAQHEARDDRRILEDLAIRLGFWEEYTEGLDPQGWLRKMYERARDEARDRGIPLPGFDEFWSRGHVRYPDLPSLTPFSEFRSDPQAHPLATPSGRIEIFSETVDAFGYPDCPGHPTWIPAGEWLGAEAASAYPLHLLSPQPAWRLHSQLDMGRVSASVKIDGHEPCTLNRADAQARGIADGDVIRIWNDRGTVYAGAVLSDLVMPGVALLPTGAWYTPVDPSVPSSPDSHGNPNMLSRDVGTSRLAQGPSAQSLLVEIARADDAPAADPFALPPLRSR